MSIQADNKNAARDAGQTTTVKCGNNHSGNHNLTMGARRTWECDGCADFYTISEVIAAEKSGKVKH